MDDQHGPKLNSPVATLCPACERRTRALRVVSGPPIGAGLSEKGPSSRVRLWAIPWAPYGSGRRWKQPAPRLRSPRVQPGQRPVRVSSRQGSDPVPGRSRGTRHSRSGRRPGKGRRAGKARPVRWPPTRRWWRWPRPAGRRGRRDRAAWHRMVRCSREWTPVPVGARFSRNSRAGRPGFFTFHPVTVDWPPVGAEDREQCVGRDLRGAGLRFRVRRAAVDPAAQLWLRAQPAPWFVGAVRALPGDRCPCGHEHEQPVRAITGATQAVRYNN